VRRTSNPAECRLDGGVGYVKFVDAQPVAGDGLSPLPGCYLPAHFARVLLERTARDTGRLPPFDPRTSRYIDTQTFHTLVAGGWIGTNASVAALLGDTYLPFLNSPGSGPRTMAFDEPMPPTRATSGDRATGRARKGRGAAGSRESDPTMF
jgi:hypothetical protein